MQGNAQTTVPQTGGDWLWRFPGSWSPVFGLRGGCASSRLDHCSLDAQASALLSSRALVLSAVEGPWLCKDVLESSLLSALLFVCSFLSPT